MARFLHSSSARTTASEGYSLVILVMAITTLNILVAMALPSWSSLIQRDKEEELIFRGLQYAEAIRCYQIRHGGNPPVRMEALLKEEPRCIRQFWPNPMREDGKWTLIIQGAVNPNPNGDGNPNPNPQQPPEGDNDQPPQPGQPGQPPQLPTVEFDPENPEEQQAVGPIIGVYSSEGDEAIKLFNNSSTVSEWQFRADMFGVPMSGADGIQQCPPVNSSWIGRPFPPGITPPCLAGGQGQQIPPPNGQPPPPPNRN